VEEDCSGRCPRISAADGLETGPQGPSGPDTTQKTSWSNPPSVEGGWEISMLSDMSVAMIAVAGIAAVFATACVVDVCKLRRLGLLGTNAQAEAECAAKREAEVTEAA
jgi:hypothetical protein